MSEIDIDMDSWDGELSAGGGRGMMDCGSLFQLCEVCRATHAPPDREGRFMCWACFVEDAALQSKEARRKSVEAAGKSFVSRHRELLGKLAKTEGEK